MQIAGRDKTLEAEVDPQLKQWLAESEQQLTSLLHHLRNHHTERGTAFIFVRSGYLMKSLGVESASRDIMHAIS